jgi:hypothetical protein
MVSLNGTAPTMALRWLLTRRSLRQHAQNAFQHGDHGGARDPHRRQGRGRCLGIGQSFVHQNRIRQAASSLGAAVYCIEESVRYARLRRPFGKPLASNQAMQVHGGIGYSRHMAFEHIYRHHRRYRITEGSEEIQIRKVGAFLFGFLGPKREAFKQMEEEYLAARAAGHNDREIDI